MTFKLLKGQRRQKISIYLWTSSCKSPLYMFWSGSRWNNLKQRQKPIISVDINVIKLVRKSICAIFVGLKEKFSLNGQDLVVFYQNTLKFQKLILFLRFSWLSYLRVNTLSFVSHRARSQSLTLNRGRSKNFLSRIWKLEFLI